MLLQTLFFISDLPVLTEEVMGNAPRQHKGLVGPQPQVGGGGTYLCSLPRV
jgi:hypothetical protein